VKDSKPVGKASNPAVTASKPAGKDVAVLRLVKLQEYVDAARNGSSSLCYDFLDPSLYVDAPFEELMATVRNDTAVVSWRWPFRKPGTENGWKDKFDPEDEEAGRDQKLPDDLLDTIASKYNPQKWLWLDWACVPQYGRGDTMKAIELSGTVYREAANMIMWESNAVPGFRIGRQYMSRAWTLAERIQRRKKRLTVRDFLSPSKLDEIGALLSDFDAASESADWKALASRLFATLYKILSPLPQDTEDQESEFLMKSPFEVAGLHSASAYEASTFYVIDQVKVMGWVQQNTIMNDLEGISDEYSGFATTGGIDGATYTKFLSAGGQMASLPPHPPQSAAWWRAVATNVHALLTHVLNANLVEGGQGGWLLDYLCRSAAVQYQAFSARDLLICLLASGVLSDANLDAKKPMKGYDEVVERVVDLLQLSGIESQLSLLFMKDGEDTPVTPSQPDVPSWHPLNFCGDLVLPESVYSRWKAPTTLGEFMQHTQTLVRRTRCRANLFAAAVHSAGKSHVCGQAIVQDVDAACGFSSWWPMDFVDQEKCGIVKWYNERIQQYASSLAQRDWSKPHTPAEPKLETVQHTVKADDEVAEPGTKLALRLTLFPQQGSQWFTGKVDAGGIARDLVVDMVWTLSDDETVARTGAKNWVLESRQSDLKDVSPSIVSDGDLKGQDPDKFDPAAIICESFKQANQDARALLAVALG